MTISTITLYMNDSMGKRWSMNKEAAGRAEKEFGAQIVIVKKTSPNMPKRRTRHLVRPWWWMESTLSRTCFLWYVENAILSEREV